MADKTVDKTSIDFYNKQFSAMETEYSTFLPHHRELSEFISPRRGRFLEQDRNKGIKKHRSIINSAATQALRVAVAGMLNGTMSPSRPWFALETLDPDMMENAQVRNWLWQVELILREILNASNFYNMAPTFLKELLLFGTTAMTHVDDFENVARFYAHTAGSYYLGQNGDLEIDRLARSFEWPVIQIIGRFGYDNCSTTVKNLYDRGNYFSWVPIRHFICPNEEKTGNRFKDKPFKSVYFEPGNSGVDKDKFLSVAGFETFPAYAVRWDVTEGDIYGVDCPGMTALGDVKQLQLEEKKKAQAIEKHVNPPLQGPPAVKNVPVSGLPGGLTTFEGDDSKQPLRPIYQVEPRLQELRLDMDAVERRIQNAFFNDLFLAISNMEGIQPRNQLDLSQRNEERLVQLGPVLERLHGEFLATMVDRVFNQAVKADILPPAPEPLQGTPLRVRFISTLAMAQRSVVTQDLERMTTFVGGLVQLGKEDVLDKFDADQAVDEYSKAIGLPPSVIVPDEVVAKTRGVRQQQMEAARQAEQIKTMTETAATAGDIPTDEGHAGKDVVDAVKGMIGE
jgi:hypothetical protein